MILRYLNRFTQFNLLLGIIIVVVGCSQAAEEGPGDSPENPTQEPAEVEINEAAEVNEVNVEESVQIEEENPSESSLESYLDQLGEAGFSGSVLVAQNGEIVVEKGYGLADITNEVPITPETVFDTGSLSKQFTAAAILLLAEQGKLQIEDTLADHFDDVPEEKMSITLHQLLTHSSGLPGYVYAGDFVETGRQEAESLALEADLENQPGSEYLYSDTGYGLLAAVVEKVSGQSFQSYLQENLFEPAGMTRTGFYNDPKWEELTVANGYNNGKDFGSAALRPGPYWGLLGFGGVLSTTGDLFLWGQALKENLILNETSTAKLFTPYIKEFEDGESYYGYGWVVEALTDEVTSIWHDGGTDSQNAIMLMYDDPQETVVIVLSNQIEESLINETFYAIDTGFVLGDNILAGDYSSFPHYVP